MARKQKQPDFPDFLVPAQSYLKSQTIAPVPRSTERSWIRTYGLRTSCLFFLAVLVVVAIILPVLFTVIIPSAARGMVAGAQFPIRDGSFVAISNDKLAVSFKTELKGPTGFGVHIDPFEMHLYNQETEGFHPFTSVPVPAQNIRGLTEINVKKAIASVNNHTELIKWLTKAVHDKETNVGIKAQTTAHFGAVKIHLNIDKTTSLHGLNHLSGVQITSMDLINPKPKNGNNLQGVLTLPNQSSLSLGLGNLTLDTWAGDVLIGKATMTDVYMKPGNNTIPFKGQIFLDSIMMNAVDIIDTQASSLSNGYLELGISGNATTSNGETITYLPEVLNNIKITVQLQEDELLRGLASSLIGPEKTVDMSDMVGDLAEGLDLVQIMDFMGTNITAWNVALKDALEGNTKPGTLLDLFKGFGSQGQDA